MPVQNTKAWAEGMTQAEFEITWARKYPRSDVIPLASEWIHRPEPGSKGIDSIKPSYEYEPDKFVPEPTEETKLNVIKDIKDVKVVKENLSGKDELPKLNKQDTKKNK